jgi:hypothetical protein
MRRMIQAMTGFHNSGSNEKIISSRKQASIGIIMGSRNPTDWGWSTIRNRVGLFSPIPYGVPLPYTMG